uniref:Uncharacterized protein n=1 Tax=Attheya septentrionalis TaxID=420275 RepID=A0A7S2XN60_9STRA|mmetsp:Transcript_15373/g.27889  ORF Transcript_15373/g.27889 Transcript_15373/m.27889 type:complete len:443 (+) Transcript_15373:180-1508(+)
MKMMSSTIREEDPVYGKTSYDVPVTEEEIAVVGTKSRRLTKSTSCNSLSDLTDPWTSTLVRVSSQTLLHELVRRGEFKEENASEATEWKRDESSEAPPVDVTLSQNAGRQTPSNQKTVSSEVVVNMIECERWNDLERLIGSNSNVACQEVTYYLDRYRTRSMALHLAVSSSAPVSVVEALLTANPNAALASESVLGRLPIHLAVLHNASPSVVRCLVECQTDCVKRLDSEGNLPLHLASEFASHNEILSILLDAYPGACQMSNAKGKLPLHVLTNRRYDTDVPSLEILERVMKEYPKGISQPDARGALPLHGACNRSQLQIRVLEALLSAEPSTILKKDGSDRTPLGIAKRVAHHHGHASKLDANHHSKDNDENAIQYLSSCMRKELTRTHGGNIIGAPIAALLMIQRSSRHGRSKASGARSEEKWMGQDVERFLSPVTRTW